MQVTQSNGEAHRNLLISRKPALVRHNVFTPAPAASQAPRGVATWSNTEIALQLEALGLGTAMPISCLAVETLPASQGLADPLGANLGYERILRTSPLTAIPAVC